MSTTRKISAVKTDAGAQEREAAKLPFEFEHDGETFELPHASKIKAGVYRRVRQAEDELLGMFLLLEEVASEEAYAALEDKELEEFGEVIQAWQEWSGTSVGE